jgi:hypothetical protein
MSVADGVERARAAQTVIDGWTAERTVTWVSRPIPPRVIDADALFADHIRRYGP